MLRFMFCKDAGRTPQLFRHSMLYIHYIYWFNIATVNACCLHPRFHSAQKCCKFFLKVKCLHFSKMLMVYSEHSLELAAAISWIQDDKKTLRGRTDSGCWEAGLLMQSHWVQRATGVLSVAERRKQNMLFLTYGKLILDLRLCLWERDTFCLKVSF